MCSTNSNCFLSKSTPSFSTTGCLIYHLLRKGWAKQFPGRPNPETIIVNRNGNNNRLLVISVLGEVKGERWRVGLKTNTTCHRETPRLTIRQWSLLTGKCKTLFTSQTVSEMFCLQFGRFPVPPPLHPSDRDSVFQQPPGSRAGGAEIRELHCQAGMIYLTNISIQPRTRISNEARAKAERA